jgi:lipoyl synthase
MDKSLLNADGEKVTVERSGNEAIPVTVRLPEWARRSVLNTEENRHVRTILKEQRLNTICESGRCPNKGECWAAGTATFMLMGDVCTRTCQFCAVNKGLPAALDPEEPNRVVNASKSMGLKHVVLTSVNRDELPDQGAGHFAQTINALKEAIPGIAVEILTPDFQGREDCLATVLAAKPAVFNHNLETVPRLYRRVRPGSKYKRSLDVLAAAKRLAPTIPTKSGIMLGLGESKEEVHEVLRDLRAHNCDILTLGQYLRPSLKQLPVDRYVTPDEFAEFAAFAERLGFSKVHSGPLVRSSYHAAEVAQYATKPQQQ